MAEFGNGYKYRKKVSLRQFMIPGGFSNTPLQVLFETTDPKLRLVGAGGEVESADRIDIRFEDLNGNKLYHELSNYDETTGKVRAWVRMPITSGSDNSFYVYFGKRLQKQYLHGIEYGISDVSKLVLSRNMVGSTYARDRLSVAFQNLRDSSGNSLAASADGAIYVGTNPSYRGTVNYSANSTDGYIMYSSTSINTRLGYGTHVNSSFMAIFRKDNRWYYNIGDDFKPLTVQDGDIIVAKLRWNTGADGDRSVDYAATAYSGEQEPDYAWCDNITIYDKYGFGLAEHYNRQVLHLDNNQGQGNAVINDQTVFSNVGRIKNSIANAQGVMGGGIDFSGKLGRIELNHSSVVNNRTVSMWVKFTNIAGVQTLMTHRTDGADPNAYGIHLINGVLYIDIKGANFRLNTGWRPTASHWAHLAVVTSDVDTRLYVNSNLIYKTNIGGSPGAPVAKPSLGATETGTNPADIVMDEYRNVAVPWDDKRIKFEYANSSPVQFLTIGNTESKLDVASSEHSVNLQSPSVSNNVDLITWTFGHLVGSEGPSLNYSTKVSPSDRTHTTSSTLAPIHRTANVRIGNSLYFISSTSPGVIADGNTVGVSSGGLRHGTSQPLVEIGVSTIPVSPTIGHSSESPQVNISTEISIDDLLAKISSEDVLVGTTFGEIELDELSIRLMLESAPAIMNWDADTKRIGNYIADRTARGDYSTAELGRSLQYKRTRPETGIY